MILASSKDFLKRISLRPAPHLELTTEFRNKELSMAIALIKGYQGEFDPMQYKDLYQKTHTQNYRC
jgi:non-homologous end joining protein Ku